MHRPGRVSLVLDERAFARYEGRPILRDFQLREIETCFLAESSRPIHAWVHGPAGAGKTLCVRHLLEGAKQSGLIAVYVNCRERFTFLSVVEAILQFVKPLRGAQRTREYQLAVLQGALQDRRAVIALDEIDALRQQDAADLLHRLCSLPRTSVVCIAPTRQPLLGLPETTRSRLSPRQVLFPRYSPEEIMSILLQTAAQALRPGSWTRPALEKIVGQSYGDARRALTLLRHAVQRAEDCGDERLQAHHLEGSQPGDRLSLDDRLEMLSTHHRMLHDVVRSRGPIPGPDLDREYRVVCRQKSIEPIAPRTASKYLNTLCRQRVLTREHGAGTSGWIYRAAAAPESF